MSAPTSAPAPALESASKPARRELRMNALRHGLTGHVVVMTSEDQQAYQSHCQLFQDHFEPVGMLEQHLTQRIADVQWRLYRAASQESNLLALGAMQTEMPILDGPLSITTALTNAETLRDHAHVFATLSIYEQRLTRSYEKTIQQLQSVQNIRFWREKQGQR